MNPAPAMTDTVWWTGIFVILAAAVSGLMALLGVLLGGWNARRQRRQRFVQLVASDSCRTVRWRAPWTGLLLPNRAAWEASTPDDVDVYRRSLVTLENATQRFSGFAENSKVTR